MNAGALKYLAAVSDLSRLDLEAVGVTLVAGDEAIESIYAGNYARGKRAVAWNEEPFTVSVSASRFKTIASMFEDDDAEVDLTRTDTGLRVRSKSINVHLLEWGEVSDAPLLDTDNLELEVSLPAAELIREIEIASAFVSESTVKQELTGIRLDFGKSRLKLLAYDGHGVAFESTLRTRVEGRGSVIVPSADFLLGARLVATGDVVLCKPRGENAIAIYNDSALFRSSTYLGEWPDLSKLYQKRDTRFFRVESSALRNVVAAAKAFDSGPDVNVTPFNNRVVFSVSSESGKFQTAIDGTIDGPLLYDVDALAKALRIGSVVNFNVPSEPYEPTLIECEHRKCWVVTRV